MPENIEITRPMGKDVKHLENGSLSKPIDKKDRVSEIRSEEVQEILSYIPNWMIRWGTSLIFLLILMLFVLSWFIKYPDLIQGEIKLTTMFPPVKLIANNSGKLTDIPFPDGSQISKNSKVAEIENLVTQSGIDFLKTYLLYSSKLLEEPSIEPPQINPLLVFGDMQTSFNHLQKLCANYRVFSLSEHEAEKIESLKKKLTLYKTLVQVSRNQAYIAHGIFKNAQEKYHADKLLLQKEVIAKMEFLKEESVFKQKEMEMENFRKAETENKITLANLEQEIADLEFEYMEKKASFRNDILNTINEIENGIKKWQQNYLITSSIAGKLIWLSKWNEGQAIKSGDLLFAVIPDNEEYIALINIPTHGYGKVKAGQKVRIRLNNYPFHEFGVLEGTVDKLTEIPVENSYKAEIKLINGMRTTYEKNLTFIPEMTGQAEIITEDLRVIERIINRFSKLN
jgi:hypothetical protein